jgi:hypothetical protein
MPAPHVARQGESSDDTFCQDPLCSAHSKPNDLLHRPLCSGCRRNSSDGGAKAFQSAVTKVQAANALTGGALAHPEEQAQQPVTEFEMEVAALDVGLHFVEVESPDANADKVGA